MTLEIGGAVETYWKSLSQLSMGPESKNHSPSIPRPPPIGSVQASPAGSSHTSNLQPITVSSVSGSYLYVTVQITRDLHPVVFAGWQVPEHNLDLGVADLTLSQFELLAERIGRGFRFTEPFPSSVLEWHKMVSSSMLSLENLMKVGVMKNVPCHH